MASPLDKVLPVGASLSASPLGACPFCGLDISTSLADCYMFHATPTCAKFNELDAYDFLIAVKRARQT